MDTQVIEVKNNINKLQEEIYNFYKRIQENKNAISEEKKILYNICSHEWKWDSSEPFDSICKYKCMFCDLCRNPHCN